MPRSLYLVLIVFLWGSGTVLDSIVRYPIKVEYFIWESAGLPWLHFVFASANLGLLAAAIAFLLRPRPGGFGINVSAVAWAAIYGLFTTNLAISDLEGVREVYMLGREARGLSVRPEAADMIFSPAGMWSSCSLVLLFSAVTATILFRQRRWFNVADA